MRNKRNEQVEGGTLRRCSTLQINWFSCACVTNESANGLAVFAVVLAIGLAVPVSQLHLHLVKLYLQLYLQSV
jgi:hypothetical protein